MTYTIQDLPTNYDAARRMLEAGRGPARTVANNTVLRLSPVDRVAGQGIAVRYHNTDIATFYPCGAIRLEGWDSPTTHRRMDAMGLPSWGTNSAWERRTRGLLGDGSSCWDSAGHYRLGAVVTDNILWVKRAPGVGMEVMRTPDPVTVRVPPAGGRRRFTAGKRALLKALRPLAELEQSVTAGTAQNPTGLAYWLGLVRDTLHSALPLDAQKLIVDHRREHRTGYKLMEDVVERADFWAGYRGWETIEVDPENVIETIDDLIWRAGR